MTKSSCLAVSCWARGAVSFFALDGLLPPAKANPFAPGFHQRENPFADGYIQRDNPFADGYRQDSNPFSDGYVQDSNPFADGVHPGQIRVELLMRAMRHNGACRVRAASNSANG